MKNVKRDPITGRFVSTKEAGNKIMKIKEAKPKAEKTEALDVTVAEAKPKTKSKVEKKPEAVIQILEATYGISGSMVTVTENVKIGKKASNKMAGSDPAPKQKKVMIVKALVGETEVTKEFNEGEVVTF